MTRLSPDLDPCEYYTARLPCFFLSDGYAGPIATLSYHEGGESPQVAGWKPGTSMGSHLGCPARPTETSNRMSSR